MYRLDFNTALKTVDVCVIGEDINSFNFENVKTVKIEENGFYEVIQIANDGIGKPVLRLPIINTIMVIKH
jgi:hypothetical protein